MCWPLFYLFEVISYALVLRTRTIEQICEGKGLIMPKACSSRSSMTLTEAAAVQDRYGDTKTKFSERTR